MAHSALRTPRSASPLAGVLDYGMGNLRSVAKSLEAAGARVLVSDSPKVLARADVLVVPGVGSFDAAMRNLRRKRLDAFIKDWVKRDRPYLGICLGLQLLFDSSEEAPGARGLGLLAGRVRKFRPRRAALKVPHMGWNTVSWAAPSAGKADFFYFVHSYYPAPRDRSLVWAETPYGGAFCSAVRRGNLAATQFHPEKSGASGARLLRRLLRALPRACAA